MSGENRPIGSDETEPPLQMEGLNKSAPVAEHQNQPSTTAENDDKGGQSDSDRDGAEEVCF